MSKTGSRGPERWTEARVERLLLLMFGEQFRGQRPRGGHSSAPWTVVLSTLALAVLLGTLWWQAIHIERLAHQASDDQPTADVVIAEAAVTDEEPSSEIEAEPTPSEDAGESEPSHDPAESAST